VSEKFDPANAAKLEIPERLIELPPANILRLLELRGDETVVDFGAGTGMYSIPVAEALPKGRLIAVDEQEALLDMLRAKLERQAPVGRVEVVLAEDGRVPLPDGVAGRVFMINVLHHVNDDAGALAEIVRLLAPGGRLVTVEFAQMDRPVGPPNDHVLSREQVRATLTGLGLRELAVYEPGEIGKYHLAVVSEAPSA
jgi:ubiquinone/menaquinone biosynthesis C-methylase UbiE